MRSWLTFGGMLFSLSAASVADAGQRAETLAAQATLEQLAPDVQFYREPNGSRLTRAYGVGMSFGPTALASAEAFRAAHAGAFGAVAAELVAEGVHGQPDNTTPVMVDPVTGEPKFTMFTYRQYRAGVRVYGADLRILVRNLADHPTSHVSADLRDLADFQPPAVQPLAAADALAGLAADHVVEPGTEETVIFAGVDDQAAEPRLAVAFTARRGVAGDPDYSRIEIVADALNGAELHRENLIRHADVTGQVTGRKTIGSTSSACAGLEPIGMPYARIVRNGVTVYADAAGNYVIPDASAPAANAVSEVRGRWFNVNNSGVADASLSQSVASPGVANFLHNSEGTEYRTAETNAYYHANVVRDFVLSINPAYPVIGTQTDWPVNVNLNDTCNAFYDGASINFFRAGGGCNNTAIPDVVYHEYGHHLVQVAGSGQGQYGEGMSDTVGMLITRRAALGVGFDSCAVGIRSADNAIQYPCGSAIHFCGQLISGCVWDTWEALQSSNPATADAVIFDLTINSILLHTGSSITPQIYTDFLSLDDDDANLGNGTPNKAQIDIGFGLHSMIPLPPPANDAIANAIAICPGSPESGSTSWATNDGSSSCGSSTSSPDVWYVYTAGGNGTLTASLCGAGTTYDAVVSIHSGAPGSSGNQLGCDDDGCGTGGGPATTSAAVTAGNTYYIRVTGYSGGAGAYSLSISGPACVDPAPLQIALPNGAPAYVAPLGVATFDVEIEDNSEVYAAGTATLRHRIAGSGGAFASVALSDLGAGQFEAALPGGDCGEAVEFYIEAQGDLGGWTYYPANAPAGLLTANVGQEQIAIADNFEADLGWSATSSVGTTDGFWQRAVPVNDATWAYDPISDSDGSGQCYVTDNGAGNSDVDNGSVTLTSPSFDLSAGGMQIEYDYFLRLSLVGGDALTVEISSNGNAGPWIQIANHTADNGLVWTHHTISAAQLATAGVTPSADTRVRFTAVDGGTQSVVEAGVDALKISLVECVQPADCTGDVDGDNDVDLDDLLVVLGTFGQSGPGLAGDLDGDNDVDLDDLLVMLGVFGATCV